MEPNLWNRLIGFVKDSYTKRIRQAFSGVVMGFLAANGLLFSGPMADLVTAGWWIAKGVGSVILAFTTSLATSYGAYLVEQHKNRKNVTQSQRRKRKGDKAA